MYTAYNKKRKTKRRKDVQTCVKRGGYDGNSPKTQPAHFTEQY